MIYNQQVMKMSKCQHYYAQHFARKYSPCTSSLFGNDRGYENRKRGVVGIKSNTTHLHYEILLIKEKNIFQLLHFCIS